MDANYYLGGPIRDLGAVFYYFCQTHLQLLFISDQIPSSLGPAAFDGTKWLLYWADSRCEMAFIIPTEERIAMISNQQLGMLLSLI